MIPAIYWILSTEKTGTYHQFIGEVTSNKILKQQEFEAPSPGEILSGEEQKKYYSLRFYKRRNEWFNGRIGAKSLYHSLGRKSCRLQWNEIEVFNEPNGMPYFQVKGERLQDSVTISHRDQFAFCGFSAQPGLIGADMELIEARDRVFVEDFFTSEEVRQVNSLSAPLRDTYITLIWSVKEAMLKALGQGLRLDTRTVELVNLGGINPSEAVGIWRPLTVRSKLEDAKCWSTWWQLSGDYVLAVAALQKTGAEQG